MMDPVDLFDAFLTANGVSTSRSLPSGSLAQPVTIDQFVDTNFHKLEESILRSVVTEALRFRDTKATAIVDPQKALGNWGVVIDAIKEAMTKRRDLATMNFQRLVGYGMEGDNKKVDIFLMALHKKGHIDHLFMGILMETLKACKDGGNEDSYYMLEYMRKVIAALEHADSARVASQVPLDAWSEDSAQGTSQRKESSAVSSGQSTQQAVQSGNSKRSPAGIVQATAVNAAPASAEERAEEVRQRRLVAAGELLRSLIRDCAGDVKALRARLIEGLRRTAKATSGEAGEVDAPIDDAFEKALADNLEACKQAGYVNKVKLFEFMQTVIKTERAQMARFTASNGNSGRVEELGLDEALAQADAGGMGSDDQEQDETAQALSMYHAPQFLEEGPLKKVRVEGGRSTSGGGGAAGAGVPLLPVLRPEHFLEGEGVDIQERVKNKKKKAQKREARDKVHRLAEQVGQHLEQHGWAVVDNFVPLDLVRRVKIEAALFKDHYENSEIWVGKEADVGAHLSVPSVRGDRVLWMCGAHMQGRGGMAVEGMSRQVRALNDVEPCKLEARAAAPMRRFAALKEIIAACDKIVEKLRVVVPSLSGIFERSDVMLANYPGGGSRFARHIDNTTEDGRRLTLLIYLNPDWSPEMGGALRLTKLELEGEEGGDGGATAAAAADIVQEVGNRPRGGGAAAAAEGAGGDAARSEAESGEKATDPPPAEAEAAAVDVLPDAGRLAIFYSATIPHEVMPTFGDRHAVTIWYYDTAERERAVERARESGKALAASKASVEVQQAAKEFIGQLMGGDEVDAEGGDPTEQELQQLREQVEGLPDEVLGIVGNITGAPSVQSFREGFKLLTPTDLKAMRRLFRSMGL